MPSPLYPFPLESDVCLFVFLQRSGGGDSNNKIFVGGLPQNITEDHLMNFFSTFGKVLFAKL